jgi:hypothetical protein
MIYFVPGYTDRRFQPSANKLSTPPPTAIGDKCGFLEKILRRNQRKSVTYPEHRIFVAPDRFLINHLKAT